MIAHKNIDIETASNAVDIVFGQFGSSKAMSVETVRGIERVRFEALVDGQFRPVWVSLGMPTIIGGIGEVAGSMVESLFAIARDEENKLAKLIRKN